MLHFLFEKLKGFNTCSKAGPFSLYNYAQVIMSGPVNLKHVSAVCSFFPHPQHREQSSAHSLFVLFSC